MFKLLKINGSSDWSVSYSFKQNYTISLFEKVSLIKCASLCTLNEKCYSFSYLKITTEKNCGLFFSRPDLHIDHLNLNRNSKVYKKNNITPFVSTTTTLTSTLAASTQISSTLTISTLTTSTVITTAFMTTTETTSRTSTTVTPGFICNNSICTCLDSSSFYSTLQNRCLKCRNGWFPYRNICYQGFTTLRSWSNSMSYCNLLNSSLLIAEDEDKFNFFKLVSKNLTSISSNQRSWVNAQYTTLNVFEWSNGKTINPNFIMFSAVTTFIPCCFAYYTAVNSLLGIYTCTQTSNGICEYTE
ncbi:unnamed protein product [Brachionus calyciflorus]|uniref:C-type lectin domain-containing protein n=1 Tax=Brachionus calyciflorus TaxID=104777 RepID=A0A814ELN1_9BILA|nr:unnamed protein product [Brachionus calyciflorus]